MESFRATHFGPGPRLAGLAALLRTASGAPVPVIADLADGLALPAGTTSCLVLDLAAVPIDDLGLLRRLRARQPGLFVLWTGAASLATALPTLADAGDEFRPWPLDVTLLPGFEVPTERTGTPLERTGAPVERAGDPAGRAALPAERRDNLDERSAAPAVAPHRAAPERAPAAPPRELAPTSAGGPSGPATGPPSSAVESILDPELRHIEAILAGFERRSLANVSSSTVTAPRPTRGPSAVTTAPTPTREEPVEDELAEDEDELEDVPTSEHGPHTSPFVSDGPLLTHEELEAFLAPEPSVYDPLGPGGEEPSAPMARVAPNPAVRGLPHWYREQVADLADLVQRAELALHAAESVASPQSGTNGEHAAVLAGARLELGRLRQFARTLGCLAAPPAAGKTRLDLGVLVEETLASLAQRPAGAFNDAAAGERSEARPRFLFRSQADVCVRADKALLVAALDAILGVASAAGGAADVVRTEVLTTDAGVAEVRVDLPEGRLTGLEPTRILEPYALRKRLPGIGAHALAAAGGILVGHGGDLMLERRSQGPGERSRLVFTMRLPAL